MNIENANSEMVRFEEGLRKVLSVSKPDLKRLLEEEKATKEGKPKRGPKPKASSSSDHADRDSD